MMASKQFNTVQNLLMTPFKRRRRPDKIRVVLEGKPRPLLKMSAVTFTEDDGIVNQDFKLSMYDEIQWLTGCENRQRLFCWPCLLFGSLNIWNSTGVSDIVYLTEGAPEHEKSAAHTDADIKLRHFTEELKMSNEIIFIGTTVMKLGNEKEDSKILKPKSDCQQNLLDYEVQHPQQESTSSREEQLVVYHPTEVAQPPSFLTLSAFEAKDSDTKNIGIKKRIIDVCCLAFQLNHSNECYNISSLFEIEKCLKIMQLLKSYDSCDKYLSDDAINLIRSSPETIERMFSVLIKVVKLAIAKEIHSSKYVSLILNQHSSNESKPKISSILRYIKNGKICERFVGFTNMTSRLSADSLYKYIETILQEYGIENKICALSLDGAVLHIDDLITFLDKMKGSLPHCFFIPWHSHSINYILQQSLSSFPTCRQFFKTMAGIQAYFQENSELLTDFVFKNHPALEFIYSNSSLFSHCTSNRFASSQFIITVKRFHQAFVNFFDSIIKTCQKLDADTITKAFAFRKSLKQLQTVFLLEVFSRLFGMTYNLSTALKIDKFEFGKDNMVRLLTTNITAMRAKKFNEIWCSIEQEITQESNKVDINNEKKLRYISLFNAITKLTIREIHCRYEPLTKLTFCNMFNFEINGGLKQFQLWAQSLKATHRQFNESQIYSELTVLWSRDAFSKKSVTDFYQFLEESNLHHIFKALCNLSEFIITMPFKPASHIGDVSKLRTVEKWSGNHRSAASGDVSILDIESDVFLNLKQSSSFHDEVLSIYNGMS